MPMTGGIKSLDASGGSVFSKSRPTLHGLATTYARILDVDLDSIERDIQAVAGHYIENDPLPSRRVAWTSAQPWSTIPERPNQPQGNRHPPNTTHWRFT